MSPKRTRRRYTAEFKAEVAMAALTERQPVTELAARYQLAPAQITRWKQHLREQAAQVFAADTPAPAAPVPDVELSASRLSKPVGSREKPSLPVGRVLDFTQLR